MVLVYAEQQRGQFKKAALEAVTYGVKAAQNLGTSCVAVVLGPAENPGQLGAQGVSRVLHVNDAALEAFDSQVYTAAIAAVAEQVGATTIVLSHTSTGKSLAGRLAARLQAGSVTGANSVAEKADGGIQVKKNVFSGKALAAYLITSAHQVITVMGNSIPVETGGGAAAVENTSVSLPAARIKVKALKTVGGRTPLPEAELVVSAGRGMKGPENWGIIEELADALNATTACSRPVADSDWRPHHEHVGQTGVAIRPNLYIAVGISGAIQHLAGVNRSKVIVVINKDPEAPFFKAADYGVVGDLFEVVPKLTAAIKTLKASH